jgi:hypothetical protein
MAGGLPPTCNTYRVVGVAIGGGFTPSLQHLPCGRCCKFGWVSPPHLQHLPCARCCKVGRVYPPRLQHLPCGKCCKLGVVYPPHLQHLPHGRCGTALLATPFSNKVPGSLHTVVQGGPALSTRHHLSATAKYAPPRCYSLRSTFPCIAGWCALVMRAPRIETQTIKEK